MRRLILFAAAPAALLVAFGPSSAQAARTDIAPPGAASATALQVGDLIGVSTTGATAAADNSTAEASVLDVGGEPVLGLGGSQSGDGQNSGALVDTGSAAPARIQVAPWEASSGTTGTERTSHGSAAAARAEVPAVADVSALQSESQASHRSEKSTAAGSSDAVTLGLTDFLRVVLLHSEVSSEGTGSSYLASVNGTEIGSDEQLGEICALEVSPVAKLSCLVASGGLGADGLTSGAADLATLESALRPLDSVSAFAVRGSSGAGAEPVTAPTPTEVVAGAE
ncbi:MAG: hypothetical protein M3357_12255, partial [Actinomycetota bacterium]|nr:hypothetical protein [Actinomycetota bacterium]